MFLLKCCCMAPTILSQLEIAANVARGPPSMHASADCATRAGGRRPLCTMSDPPATENGSFKPAVVRSEAPEMPCKQCVATWSSRQLGGRFGTFLWKNAAICLDAAADGSSSRALLMTTSCQPIKTADESRLTFTCKAPTIPFLAWKHTHITAGSLFLDAAANGQQSLWLHTTSAVLMASPPCSPLSACPPILGLHSACFESPCLQTLDCTAPGIMAMPCNS
jgi:hypothetical protein